MTAFARLPVVRKIDRWRRQFKLRGNAVECPCCHGTFRELEPHRDLPNRRCPRCGSLERHRLLWLFLERETDLFTRRQSLLHIAPEQVYSAKFAGHATIDYVSGDLGPGKAMEVMDVTAIDRPDGSFDAVMCNHVLEHVPDDRRAMSELFRVLKPGGVAYMQHPIDYALERTYEDASVTSPEDRMREFGQEDHVRWYGSDFVERLRSVGFDVTMRRYADELDSATLARICVDESRFGTRRGADIYVCTRAATS